jgi:hypothetical protein
MFRLDRTRRWHAIMNGSILTIRVDISRRMMSASAARHAAWLARSTIASSCQWTVSIRSCADSFASRSVGHRIASWQSTSSIVRTGGDPSWYLDFGVSGLEHRVLEQIQAKTRDECPERIGEQRGFVDSSKCCRVDRRISGRDASLAASPWHGRCGPSARGWRWSSRFRARSVPYSGGSPITGW